MRKRASLWCRLACPAAIGWFVALAGSGVDAATSPVRGIEIKGLKVTRPEIVLQELGFGVGDPVAPQALQDARQALLDLGLFRSVAAEMDGQGVVRIVVRERRYFYALPQLHEKQEGGYAVGGRLRWSNLLGLNQRLQLRYERDSARYAAGGEDRTLDLQFLYPRVVGTRNRLDLLLRQTEGPYDFPPEAGGTSTDYRQRRAALLVSRWLRARGPTRGWRLGAGAGFRQRHYAAPGPAPRADAGNTEFLLDIAYNGVHDHLYSRTGQSFRYFLEASSDAWGSDDAYTRHFIDWFGYRWVGAPHHNLNLRLSLGLSSGRLFAEDHFTVSGSRGLRGYEDGISGNAYVLASAEYLRPIPGHRSTRGLVFVDAGNAWSGVDAVDVEDLRTAAGIGLRLRVRLWVDLDLRADAAYGFDEGGGWVFYAGSGATF